MASRSEPAQRTGTETAYRSQSESLRAESPRVTPETLKSIIRSILSQRAFQQKESDDSFWHRIGTKLLKLWNSLKRLSIGGADIPDWALILVAVCLALMVAYLVLIVIRAYKAELKAKEAVPKSAKFSPEALFMAGDEQMKKGNLREALRLYYKSVLLLLFPTLALTTTSSALARILSARNPTLSANFANLSESFNLAFYGGRDLSERTLTYFKEQTLGIFRAVERRDLE